MIEKLFNHFYYVYKMCPQAVDMGIITFVRDNACNECLSVMLCVVGEEKCFKSFLYFHSIYINLAVLAKLIPPSGGVVSSNQRVLIRS